MANDQSHPRSASCVPFAGFKLARALAPEIAAGIPPRFRGTPPGGHRDWRLLQRAVRGWPCQGGVASVHPHRVDTFVSYDQPRNRWTARRYFPPPAFQWGSED